MENDTRSDDGLTEFQRGLVQLGLADTRPKPKLTETDGFWYAFYGAFLVLAIIGTLVGVS